MQVDMSKRIHYVKLPHELVFGSEKETLMTGARHTTTPSMPTTFASLRRGDLG